MNKLCTYLIGFMAFIFIIYPFKSDAQTVTVTQNITFGEVAFISTPSTVTVTWDNTRTSSGAYVKSTSSFTRGIVTFRATAKRYNLSLTVGNTTLTRTGGGSIQFTGGATNPIGISVNNNSTTTFYFGGQIELTSSLPAGIYSGTYNITFNYN